MFTGYVWGGLANTVMDWHTALGIPADGNKVADEMAIKILWSFTEGKELELFFNADFSYSSIA